jgi:hypothetical protein
MKKVMFALCFMFGGIVVVTAQETQDTTSNQYRTETQSQSDQAQNQDQNQNQDRERIQSTELPDAIKRSLEGPEYRGWLVSGAFKSSSSSSQQSTTGQSSMESETTTPDANRPGNTTQESTQGNTEGNTNAAGAEDEEIYIVELKNGAETKTIRFNKDGEKIEGMEGADQSTPGNQYNQNDQMNQNGQSETTPGQTSPDQSTSESESDEHRLDNDTEQSQNEQAEETSNQIDHTIATDPEKDDQQ